MRSVRRKPWWAAAAAVAGLALAYAWWNSAPAITAGGPESPTQNDTREKAPLGKLIIALLVLVVLMVAWFGYRAWSQMQEKEAVARAITGGDPARAQTSFTRYGCAGCHTIPGVTGADGEVGPTLSGLLKRVYIGGVLRNTSENLIAWIVLPQKYSPNSAMPATGITEGEARDVAAYLYAH